MKQLQVSYSCFDVASEVIENLSEVPCQPLESFAFPKGSFGENMIE